MNKVSIQLALDGHSFSAPALAGGFPGEGPVEVELLTPQTMLVPSALFDPASASEMLAAGGIPVRHGECVVWSDPQRETVAVMALPAEALRQVGEKLASRACFTSPLLHELPAGEPTVWICRKAELLYIKVYDRALQFAEVIPAPEEADIRYFLERLAALFPPADYTLRLAGDAAKPLRKLLGRNFRETLCE